MDLLRLATAGSVDDGKSTLIGRLLYETGSVPKDRLQAIEAASRRRGAEGLDLSLLTDGLIAEREQGITIDVAHVYFATPKRRFIIADTPGHVEYTRNMVTGASTASVSVILIDARNGLVEQTHRHYFISALLRIPTVVVCVNKMDLVGLRAVALRRDRRRRSARWPRRCSRPTRCCTSCRCRRCTARTSPRRRRTSGGTPGRRCWTLLETADTHQRASLPARLQVQRVLRPRNEGAIDVRAYAGRVASGTFAVGDDIVVQPGERRSRIASLTHHGRVVTQAEAGDSVSLELTDDIDVGRGSVLASAAAVPPPRRSFDATICWLDEQPLRPERVYLLQHGVHRVRAKIAAISGLIDVTTLQATAAAPAPAELRLNQLATVSIRLGEPIYADAYADNPPNGAFVIIDTDTSSTAGVGFVSEPARRPRPARCCRSTT